MATIRAVIALAEPDRAEPLRADASEGIKKRAEAEVDDMMACAAVAMPSGGRGS